MGNHYAEQEIQKLLNETFSNNTTRRKVKLRVIARAPDGKPNYGISIPRQIAMSYAHHEVFKVYCSGNAILLIPEYETEKL